METESTTSQKSGGAQRRRWRRSSEKALNIQPNLHSSQTTGLGDWQIKDLKGLKKVSRDSSRFSKNSSRENGSTSWDYSMISGGSTRHLWRHSNPRFILVAACDNCAIMDLEGGGPPYHGLDYQVKLQLLPILEKKQGLQFRKVRRCHVANEGSWLEIECGNEMTYYWLKDVANVPFTNNQGVFIRFYPAHIRYKYVIVRLPLIEGSNDKFSMELFRQRCRKQNPPLNTWHWRLIDRKRVLEGDEAGPSPIDEARYLLLEVPEETTQYLEDHYWSLFYQLGKIHFEPTSLRDVESVTSIPKIKSCKDSICTLSMNFTKYSFRNKSLLPNCPVVQFVHSKLEMEENISENSEEQLIGITDMSLNLDDIADSLASCPLTIGS